MAGTRVEVFKLTPPRTRAMGRAIGFAAILVVLGIFMPEVLHALSAFLLAALSKATAFIQTLPAR